MCVEKGEVRVGNKTRRRCDKPPKTLIDLSNFKITTDSENVAATKDIIKNTIDRFG